MTDHKRKYIDIHAHLNFAAFDPDREEAIARAERAGVGVINVGTQIDTSRAAVELAHKHEGMWAAVGLHPIHTSASRHDLQELGDEGKAFTSRGEKADLDAYRKLAADPKVVAIGECGLDYYRLDDSALGLQSEAFESMIDLANEVRKPLMLHIRNGSGRSAYDDACLILKERSKIRGNLHFFAGSIGEARQYLDMGYTFSFTGVITFARDYDEVIRYLPLERIMSETDCPYVTPVPNRGKRNEPSYVPEIVRKISDIRGEDSVNTANQLLQNALGFFGIV